MFTVEYPGEKLVGKLCGGGYKAVLGSWWYNRLIAVQRLRYQHRRGFRGFKLQPETRSRLSQGFRGVQAKGAPRNYV
jgi:hypothetical protein